LHHVQHMLGACQPLTDLDIPERHAAWAPREHAVL
jgi:hypothetical protein